MIEEFSRRTGYSTNELLGRSRKYEVAIVRELYWKLLREIAGYQYGKIARLCERDHSTIIAGIRHANDLLEVGDEVATGLWEKVSSMKVFVKDLEGTRIDLMKAYKKWQANDYCGRF